MARLKLRMRRALVAGIVAGLAMSATAATPDPVETAAPSPGAGESTAAPVEATSQPEFLRLGADAVERMTLPVEIGGLGPYPFLIDTGSQRSIVSTELAERLMLRTLPPVTITSMAGKEIVSSVHLGELRFGNQVVSDLPALSIAHANLGGAGLIGLDTLRDKRVMLDFKGRRLGVEKSRPANYSANDPDVIVVRAKSKLGQLILVDSRVDGRKVNVILDTGAEISVGNMALLNELRVKRLVVPPRPTQLTSVTGAPIEAQFAVVRRITIESVVLENVPMVFLDAAPFDELGLGDRPAMLLGMRMLRMFEEIAIDFGSRHVDFRFKRGQRGAGPLRFASALPTGTALN